MPPIPSAIRKLPKTEPATTPSLVRDFIVPSARDRMRHAVPDGDIAEIFDRAITLLLRNVERRFAEGGETTTENLQLRCRSHNAYEAREHFGFSLPTARGENHSSHTDVHDSGWRDRATLKRKCV